MTADLRWGLLLTALLTAGALAAPPAATKQGPVLYRWKDANGVLQLGNVLPPAAAAGGYEVLDARTLKLRSTVAPALGPAELEAQRQAAAAEAQASAQAAAEQAAVTERARQDQVLIDSYGSVAELERARDQQLETLRLIKEAAGSTIERLQGNLAQMQQSADAQRAAGKPVPPVLAQHIVDTQGRIARQQGLVVRTGEQEAALRSRFARDITRLRELLAPTAAPAR